VGGIAPEDLREHAGRDDVVLWGMVPGAMFADPWTDEQFEAHVRHIFEVVEGPMILGSADQVPPDGRLERVRLAGGIARECGR